MLMACTNVHETDHYEVVDEGKKSTPLGAGVYEEVDKQDTEGHNKHYQEMFFMKMDWSEYTTGDGICTMVA